MKYTKGQSSLQELTGVVIVCDDSQYTKNDMQYLRIALSDCEGTYGDGSTRSRDEFAFNLFQGGGMDTLCDLLDVDEIEETDDLIGAQMIVKLERTDRGTNIIPVQITFTEPDVYSEDEVVAMIVGLDPISVQKLAATALRGTEWEEKVKGREAVLANFPVVYSEDDGVYVASE